MYGGKEMFRKKPQLREGEHHALLIFSSGKNEKDSSGRPVHTDLDEADPLVRLQENGRPRHRVHAVRLYSERVECGLGVGLVGVGLFAVQFHLREREYAEFGV